MLNGLRREAGEETDSCKKRWNIRIWSKIQERGLGQHLGTAAKRDWRCWTSDYGCLLRRDWLEKVIIVFCGDRR